MASNGSAVLLYAGVQTNQSQSVLRHENEHTPGNVAWPVYGIFLKLVAKGQHPYIQITSTLFQERCDKLNNGTQIANFTIEQIIQEKAKAATIGLIRIV